MIRWRKKEREREREREREKEEKLRRIKMDERGRRERNVTRWILFYSYWREVFIFYYVRRGGWSKSHPSIFLIFLIFIIFFFFQRRSKENPLVTFLLIFPFSFYLMARIQIDIGLTSSTIKHLSLHLHFLHNLHLLSSSFPFPFLPLSSLSIIIHLIFFSLLFG